MTTDLRRDPATTLPTVDGATLAGRIFVPGHGPRLVVVRGAELVDITDLGPTMAHLTELPDAAARIAAEAARSTRTVHDLATVLASTAARADSARGTDPAPELAEPVLLAPTDLHALKAAGVTFARSMLERVIEEQVGGDAAMAVQVRDQIQDQLGESVRDVRPGSPEALAVLEVLRGNGLWSQYLEVGLGRYPEIFTKAQVLSAVGHGADVGVSAISSWNNPEPELVLIVDSTGVPRGVTLGNDVNLRDVEGASALLLPLAKDNNASASLGPFIRFFDNSFELDEVSSLSITMRIDGTDGFHLEATAPQSEASRSAQDLVTHAIGRRHQYPDGLALYCGTPFAPTQDRDAPGSGFTHHVGDVVQIAAPELGTLVNHVVTSEEAPRWEYGIRDLLRDLA